MVPRSLAIIESAMSRLSPLVSLCDAFELPWAVAFVPLVMFHAVLSIIPPASRVKLRGRGLRKDSKF
jgi:hypothetical protein